MYFFCVSLYPSICTFFFLSLSLFFSKSPSSWFWHNLSNGRLKLKDANFYLYMRSLKERDRLVWLVLFKVHCKFPMNVRFAYYHILHGLPTILNWWCHIMISSTEFGKKRDDKLPFKLYCKTTIFNWKCHIMVSSML